MQSHLKKYKDHDEEQSKAFFEKAQQYAKKIITTVREKDYIAHESALTIAGDDVYQDNIQNSLKRFSNLTHVILVGIGGSNLGTEAVYRALRTDLSPQLHVYDSIEREDLKSCRSLIESIDDINAVAIVIVSKSGNTTETMLNAEKILEFAGAQFGEEVYDRIIFVGNADTAFIKAGNKSITRFIIPDAIGGRYSVFTAVGMVPLTLLDIDIEALRRGAIDAISKKEMKQHVEVAIELALHAEEGIHGVNTFVFNKRLEYCANWYRQLLAESFGKSTTKDGTTFNHQLLPIVSMSVDLHSMAQLYLGGYKNLYTHFMYYNESEPYHLQQSHWLTAHVPFLAGADIQVVKQAITQGVLQAYNDQKLPHRITQLEALTAYEIGFLLSAQMCETMILADIFNINAFDQPNVESYKVHVRSLLK